MRAAAVAVFVAGARASGVLNIANSITVHEVGKIHALPNLELNPARSDHTKILTEAPDTK